MLIGRITRDPELKTTLSGFSICDLSIAINRNYTTKDGEKKEEVVFAGVKAMGKQAEIVNQYFAKGDPIYVEGRLTQDQWEDRETGKKREKTYVVMEKFEFLSSKGDSDSDSYQSPPPPRRESAPAKQESQQSDLDLEEDVPF